MDHGDDKFIAEATASGSVSALLCGAAVIVLSILGLVKVLSPMMMGIAIIVAGASFLFKGASIVAEYRKLLARVGHGHHFEIGGGMTVDILGGATGIILGLLALVGVAADALSAIAILVFGATALLSTGVASRLNALKSSTQHEDSTVQAVLKEITHFSIDTQVFVGLGVIVLGILALINDMPSTVLIFVALLAIGGANILAEGAITARVLGLVQRD